MIALLNKVIDSPIKEEEIKDYLPPAYEALCHLDKKEIIKRFVSVEFNHFLEYYRHAGDINVKPRANDTRSQGRRSDHRNSRPRTESADFKRFSINMGKANKINAGAIVRIICENCGVKSNQVGEISLGHDQSFFDVKKESVDAVREGMSNVRLDGRKVSVRSATPQRGGRQGGPRQRSGRQGGGRRRN
jgi:ATP-dependent RNA helicase DeaD